MRDVIEPLMRDVIEPLMRDVIEPIITTKLTTQANQPSAD